MLDGQCFHTSTSEYTYELCLYKSAKQTPSKRGGGGSGVVELGRRWAWRPRAASGGQPIVGVLSGGARCFGPGVDRSLVVTFECAAQGETLGKVSEPSPCVYEATLSTPAACE